MERKEDPSAKAALLPVEIAGQRTLALDCDLFLAPDSHLQEPAVTRLTFDDLTIEILTAVAPTMIILPLFAAGHDAMAVIERLEELGYSGRLTVLAPELPKPRIVERELRNLGPGPRLTLISP